MSLKKKKPHTAEFKAKVALEALQENKTIAEIGAAYGIHPKTVGLWKQEFLANASIVFNRHKQDAGYKEELRQKEEHIEALYKEVGQLTLEVNWMKKKSRQAGLI